jgi:hypothetical protein
MSRQTRIDHRARPTELVNQVIARGLRLAANVVQVDPNERTSALHSLADNA